MVLSWQDHDRTLRCELSVASFRSEREIRLQVQCECVRGHTLVAEPHVHGSPVKSRGTETVPEAKPDTQGSADGEGVLCSESQVEWLPSTSVGFKGSILKARRGRKGETQEVKEQELPRSFGGW